MDISSSFKDPVMVTGGAGFIGQHLVNRLLEQDVPVTVLDLPAAARPAEWDDRVRFIGGDVCVVEDVRRALEGVGTVYHAASVVSDWAAEADFQRVVIDGSRNLFEQALRSNARVVLISTCSVYGDRIGRDLLREDIELGRPLGRYGDYKQRQEALAWRYHKEQGLPLTVVRPSKVYGPGATVWVDRVVEVLCSGGVALIDGGYNTPGLVYIDNLVDILLLAGASPKAVGQIYNGYDGTDTSMRQYTTDIASRIGAPPPRSLPSWAARPAAALLEPVWRTFKPGERPPLTREMLHIISSEFRISTEKIQADLGYVPRVSYTEGLERLDLTPCRG